MIACVKFLQNFMYQKLLKSIHFHRVIQEIIWVEHFFDRVVIARC